MVLYVLPLHPDDIETLRARIIASTDTPIILNDGLSLKLSLSVGLAIYLTDGQHIDDLFTTADNDMYSQKTTRKLQNRR